MQNIVPSRGSPAANMIFENVRELTAADIFQLLSEKPVTTAAPIIQRVSDNHRRAARLLAGGRDVREVAIIVGRTPQRISDLKKDPTFCELIAYYAEQIIDVELEDGQRIQAKFKDMTEQAQDEILERLEDETQRKRIPISELRQIAQLGADRTVAPPRQAQPSTNVPQNITFNIGARDLRPENEKLIDVTPEKVKE